MQLTTLTTTGPLPDDLPILNWCEPPLEFVKVSDTIAMCMAPGSSLFGRTGAIVLDPVVWRVGFVLVAGLFFWWLRRRP